MLYFKLCRRKWLKRSGFSDKSWNKSHLHQTVVVAVLCPGVGFTCTTSLYNCSLLILPGSIVEAGCGKGWFITYIKTRLSPREHLMAFWFCCVSSSNWPRASLAFQCHHRTLQPGVGVRERLRWAPNAWGKEEAPLLHGCNETPACKPLVIKNDHQLCKQLPQFLNIWATTSQISLDDNCWRVLAFKIVPIRQHLSSWGIFISFHVWSVDNSMKA